MDRIIGVIGLNFRSAPLEIREKGSFSNEEADTFVRLLKHTEWVSGAVVLSTCNRVEIYYHQKGKNVQDARDLILQRFIDFKQLDVSIRKYVHTTDGHAAVKHLFRVASSLDSMVLGEDQIIGQVKSAFQISESAHCAGPVLTRLFNRAFNAGKKVRTETKINEGCASVSSAGVLLALKQHPNIQSLPVLLVGAGQAGRLAVMSLLEKGTPTLFISNRTFSKAEKLATEFNATAVPFQQLHHHLLTCDLLMIATGSKTPLIDGNTMQEIMQKRSYRPLTILDLSVPRNVTGDAGNIHQVTLYDVDDTNALIQKTIEKRKAEILKAEFLVESLADEYMEWLTSLHLSPIIRQIKEHFRKIHEAEFNNYLKCNDEACRDMVMEYGTHLSDKLAGQIIKNIKELTGNGKNTTPLNLLNRLFESSPHHE